MRGPMHLTDRNPVVTPVELMLDLVPPPHFTNVRFSTYVPDPAQPSQARAVQELRKFSLGIGAIKAHQKHRGRKYLRKPKLAPAGVYLDGGFGVGKSHLLAALCQTAAGRCSFGTFSEYTNILGALGHNATLAALANNSLVCIDEFELDYSPDTRAVGSLMFELAARGIKLAATSAALPESLGVRPNTAAEFKGALSGVGKQFEIIRIKGGDFLRRDPLAVPEARSNYQVAEAATQITASLDSFDKLIRHLSTIHPSRYAALLNGLRTVCVLDVRQLTDEADALRFVVFVDRLYDRNLAFVASGVPFDRVFSDEMLMGDRRKKYLRAVARLNSLATSS